MLYEVLKYLGKQLRIHPSRLGGKTKTSIWSPIYHVIAEVYTWKYIGGGNTWPTAFIQQQRETRVPRSAEVIWSTCFSPFWVVKPVSSKFYIWRGSYACLQITVSKLSKNWETFIILKLIARDKLVAFGFRKPSSFFFFVFKETMQPINPPFYWHDGHGFPFRTVYSYASRLVAHRVRP